MDNKIDLTKGADLDKKYFTAFLKGLMSIKYKDLFAKVARANNDQDAAQEEVMDLDFLYSNLFNQEITSADTFNHLVEQGLKLIAALLEINLPRNGGDAFEDFLNRKVRAEDETRKAILLFWKQEQPNLLTATRLPLVEGGTGIRNQGLQDIDWEIQSIMAGRHQPNANQQSATVVISAKKGDKFMFEATKSDVKLMLDKIAVIDQLIAQ